ncbi:MAG: sigma-70 family RNA polymerase sigma factor [Planctomycetota bacterium]
MTQELPSDRAPIVPNGFEYLLRAFVRSRLPASLHRYIGVSDILQSVMLVAMQQRQQFQGNELTQYRGWLLRIAERKIIDKIRRFRLRECPSDLQADFARIATPIVDQRDPSQGVSDAEEATLLLEAIEKLPDEIQRIIAMRNVESKTFNQIADELDLPLTTCRRRWCEGLEMLGSLLERHWGIL